MGRPDDITVVVVNPGADVYGSDLQMLESVSALVEAGARVVAWCPAPGPLVDRLVSRGATVHVQWFPVVRRSYLSVRGALRLAGELARSAPAMVRTMRDLQPAVVYVNTTTIPWWLVLARLCRMPVVCHVHEAEERDRTSVLRALNAPLLLATRVVLNSRNTARVLWRLVPGVRSRSSVVLNGVPDRPEPPVPPLGQPGLTRLAVVGRLSPRKGPQVAVAAVKVLLDQGVPVCLELAGSVFPGYEWFEEDLRALVAKEGLENHVTFTGFVSPSSVAFDRAHIVLAPSFGESLGNAVIEAQLAQRPVVATRVGGHLESVRDEVTGLLVEPGDAADLARAIRRLVDDPQLRARLGQRGRQEAVRIFSLARYRREIAEVVLSCVRDPLPARGRRSRSGTRSSGAGMSRRRRLRTTQPSR